MKRAPHIRAALLIIALIAPASAREFLSSDLPIVILSTPEEEEEIPDEPKIDAWMGIIDNGPGVGNRIDDPPTGYDGRIGIERRGSSTQAFPKKSYALETRDERGENLDVSLLGMPPENDWILYAPYSDKSLLRNVLACRLADRMGRYASRTRFCEVVLDGDYQGVYVLMEKIKRDDNRVDIADLDPDEIAGEDLTGGYIIRVDRYVEGEDGGWYSSHAFDDGRLFYQYYFPKDDDIAPEQAAYIQGFFADLESALAGDRFADPEKGYAPYIDVGSFVDYLILNEVAKNVDAYRLSTFMYKTRDREEEPGRLFMGPVWDFNLAFGNVDYDVHPSVPLEDPVAGLQIGNRITWHSVPFWFWWRRLLQDERFVEAIAARWRKLRRETLRMEVIDAGIDADAALLAEAQERNFQRWPVLGQYVWPNYFVGQTYAEEVDYLKQWLTRRLAWMDDHFIDALRLVQDIPPEQLTTAVLARASSRPSGFALAQNYPNPFNGSTEIRFSLEADTPVELGIYDLAGQKVATLSQGMHSAGGHTFRWRGTDEAGRSLASGVYLYQLRTPAGQKTKKLLLLE